MFNKINNKINKKNNIKKTNLIQLLNLKKLFLVVENFINKLKMFFVVNVKFRKLFVNVFFLRLRELKLK